MSAHVKSTLRLGHDKEQQSDALQQVFSNYHHHAVYFEVLVNLTLVRSYKLYDLQLDAHKSAMFRPFSFFCLKIRGDFLMKFR